MCLLLHPPVLLLLPWPHLLYQARKMSWHRASPHPVSLSPDTSAEDFRSVRKGLLKRRSNWSHHRGSNRSSNSQSPTGIDATQQNGHHPLESPVIPLLPEKGMLRPLARRLNEMVVDARPQLGTLQMPRQLTLFLTRLNQQEKRSGSGGQKHQPQPASVLSAKGGA